MANGAHAQMEIPDDDTDVECADNDCASVANPSEKLVEPFGKLDGIRVEMEDRGKQLFETWSELTKIMKNYQANLTLSHDLVLGIDSDGNLEKTKLDDNDIIDNKQIGDLERLLKVKNSMVLKLQKDLEESRSEVLKLEENIQTQNRKLTQHGIVITDMTIELSTLRTENLFKKSLIEKLNEAVASMNAHVLNSEPVEKGVLNQDSKEVTECTESGLIRTIKDVVKTPDTVHNIPIKRARTCPAKRKRYPKKSIPTSTVPSPPAVTSQSASDSVVLTQLRPVVCQSEATQSEATTSNTTIGQSKNPLTVIKKESLTNTTGQDLHFSSVDGIHYQLVETMDESSNSDVMAHLIKQEPPDSSQVDNLDQALYDAMFVPEPQPQMLIQNFHQDEKPAQAPDPDPATRSNACPTCNKVFDNARNLSRHVYRHLGLKPFKCGICGVLFSEKHHCAKHVKNKHRIIDECYDHVELNEDVVM